MYFESVDSTQATTATQLWIPKPLSKDPDFKAAKVSYRHVHLISHSGQHKRREDLLSGVVWGGGEPCYWREVCILKLVRVDDKIGLEHKANRLKNLTYLWAYIGGCGLIIRGILVDF